MGNGRPVVALTGEDVYPRNELMSLKIDPEVRRRAEDAIASRGGRVTVGDVSTAAGLSLTQSEDALRSLAADSLATLQVSGDGEIVYIFQRGFRDAIRAKSLRLRLEPAAAKAAETVSYLGRVAFGAALLISVVTVTMAITVIASSSSRDDRGGRRGGGGGSFFGGGIYFDLGDVVRLFYFRRRYVSPAERSPAGMGFLESIFSFVLGDPDPNQDFEPWRWRLLGQYIQYRGGVVAAEEMAPYLDVTPEQIVDPGQAVVVDESYVMPALARFRGSPEVDAAGRILYRFPSLQQTARAKRVPPQMNSAQERRWELTSAPGGYKAAAVVLGLVNLVGVVYLGSLLATPANAVALARSGMAWVAGAMPLLQAYAASFFAVPAVRWVLNTRRNAMIESRNEGRRRALQALQRPSPELAAKVKAATEQAERKVIREGDVVYSSDRAVEDQPVDVEAESWEATLERRAAARELQARPSGIPAPSREQQREEQPEPRRGGWW
jgi:hypothetical protein